MKTNIKGHFEGSQRTRFQVIFSLILFFGLFAPPTYSEAATYYVDFDNGNDSNAGTSITTPWKHCPGDENATETPRSAALIPGDKVIFKGGVAYKGMIELNFSGTGGTDSGRIIYDGDSGAYVPRWGSGTAKAKIDGENLRFQAFRVYAWAATINYLTIRNFEITNLKQNGPEYPPTGGILTFFAGGTGWVIQDNNIHEIGYWQNDCDMCSRTSNQYDSCGGTGLYLSVLTNFLITGNTILKTGGIGIECGSCSNGTISNNTIGDHMIWGIDIPSEGGSPHDITISGNTLFDFYYMDYPGDSQYGRTDFWHGIPDMPNCWGPHTDFIFLRGNANDSYYPYNISIIGNTFYNNKDFSGVDQGGTAMIYSAGSPLTGCILRNNIFINPHSYATVALSGTGWQIENNTVYNGGYFGLPNGGLTSFRNNILTGWATLYYRLEPSLSGTIIDNNIYYTADPKGTMAKRQDPYNEFTFSDWRTQYPNFDANSILAPSIDSIKFRNTSGYPTTCDVMDLRLLPDSPARDVGTVISGWQNPNDRNGTPRPQGSAWDIGAYEYVQGGDTTPPAAPTGLRVN